MRRTEKIEKYEWIRDKLYFLSEHRYMSRVDLYAALLYICLIFDVLCWHFPFEYPPDKHQQICVNKWNRFLLFFIFSGNKSVECNMCALFIVAGLMYKANRLAVWCAERTLFNMNHHCLCLPFMPNYWFLLTVSSAKYFNV